MTETCLLEVVHGSRLYGTVHAESDLDITTVWLPSAQDVLLGETDWTIKDTNGHRPNTKNDVDHERMDLLRFVRSLADGQAPLIELLFAPEENHRVPAHPVFATLVDNLDLAVPCKPARFLTYMEAQAPSFGIRSPRTEVAEKAAAHLERLESALDVLKIADVADELVKALGSRFVSVGTSKTSQPMLFLCGKALAFGAAARLAADAARRIADQPSMAVGETEKDWKSVYHALRFAHEAIEFYTEGHIEFPRKDAARLMAVKTGVVPEDEVADEMRRLLDVVPRAAQASGLRDVADVDFLNDCVASVYARRVGSHFFPELSLDAFVPPAKRGL
ncbi:hypothetical protein [Rhizobium leguminosarum]|uniref:hypothetical protein n=1 Tax=Rhizobium leguminosarum TaxID=384 RepID=UPI002E121E06|nr:nucleotidyltransferase domain-containing protein [Rhizobium leguminosarum]